MLRFIIIALAVFLPSVSFAGLTCVETKYYDLPSFMTGKNISGELVLTCTFDTTPGTAVATLGADIMKNLSGKYGYTLVVAPGGTAPDAASVAIADSRGLDFMTAAGNGLTLIHATNTTQEYFEGPNDDHYQLFNAAYPITITITDQATNNAIVVFYFQLSD